MGKIKKLALKLEPFAPERSPDAADRLAPGSPNSGMVATYAENRERF
jgi:hypothetical protein